MKVKGLGAKTFQQAAGFLRIHGGTQELDATAVHPESYSVVETLLRLYAAPASKSAAPLRERLPITQLLSRVPEVAEAAGVGQATLTDLLKAVAAPGSDPRARVPPPLLRTAVLQLSDLTVGVQLPGTVRNVVPFGAFVDIGVSRLPTLPPCRAKAAPRLVQEVFVG
jgi:uncharacterized protein